MKSNQNDMIHYDWSDQSSKIYSLDHILPNIKMISKETEKQAIRLSLCDLLVVTFNFDVKNGVQILIKFIDKTVQVTSV